MSDEEYKQEGINMQLKPIKDKLDYLEDRYKESGGLRCLRDRGLIKEVLRELHELIRGLVSDLQESNSLSKATIKCYEGKLVKNLEKLDFPKEEVDYGEWTKRMEDKAENDPCGIEGKYEHWNREELENECNVLVQNIDALYVLHAKEKQELIEAFKDKLEILRDKVLEVPILSGSVQDLRDHIHDLKDLVIKNINEYDGVLKT